MSTYFALLTNIGTAKLANAAALGTKLNIEKMAVGDGGGVLPTPAPTQTALINEKRRADLNMLSIDPANDSQIIAEQVIPESEGGFWIRELGLYDDEGDLIAIANCPETYKPRLQEGSGRVQTVRMILIVSSTNDVTLKIDPSVVLATRSYVDNAVDSMQILRMTLSEARDFKKFTDGQTVYLSDIGYTFVYKSSRNVIEGHAGTEIAFDDELHKIITSGGMLEFDDYHKLRELESRNYAEYQARLRTKQPIGIVSYGDSITYGLSESGGQYENNYPSVIAKTMTKLTGIAFTSKNQAYAGDFALTNYVRNIADGTSGHISTVMLGINDVKAALDNGDDPIENISGSTLHGVNSYHIVMRKFVARELLRGRCVVVLGVTQFVSGANSYPMGNLTECYLIRTYDSVAKSIADEFGCAFVDTKRDITQQFGLSESCYDGVHLRNEFLSILGNRFSAFLMHQDYKNPCILGSSDIFIPNFLHNPVSSNRALARNIFKNGSSPPLGGAADDPESVGFMLPNDNEGGIVTIAVYVKSSNTVIWPTINSDGSDFSFDLIINNGAKQAAYPFNVDILLRDRDDILSGRSISGSAPKNRTTENYSQARTACYMHITTAGWHMISFFVGQNAGVVAVEGLVCDSWHNVKNHDVFGGISGKLVRNASGNVVTGAVKGCTQEVVGEYNVSIDKLTVDAYRVDVECSEDDAFILPRVIFKADSSFRIKFYDASGSLVNPTSFSAVVIGGR